MSATLTWFNSGLGTKTGTAVGNFYTDMKTVIDSKSGDADFTWEVSASNLGSTPYYLWLRPKGGANGRILMISWTSSPAGNNSAILDTAPSTSGTYVAWFPNGTAASPSNLTASSGSISGDDTDCCKVASAGTASTLYGTNFQPYYFDSAEGVVFCSCNPASTAVYMWGAGDLVVDGNDDAYGVSLGYNGGSVASFGNNTGPSTWVAAGTNAGSGATGFKSNYASQAAGITWFHAWQPSGAWATTSIGPSDILTDTTNTDAWFVPMALLASNIKGGGFPLKLRQICIGPSSQGQFTVYNTTGPVAAARNVSAYTTGATGYPWLTNFKV